MAAPAVAAPANAARGPIGEALSSTDSSATFESLLGRLGVNVAEIQPLRPTAGVPAKSDVSERPGGFSPPPATQGMNSAAPTQRGADQLLRRTFGGTSVTSNKLGGGLTITKRPGAGITGFKANQQQSSPITQKPALAPPPVPRIQNQFLPRQQDRRENASGGATTGGQLGRFL